MSWNSKQKSLCQLANRNLNQSNKEKGNRKKMAIARLGLMP